MEEGTSILFAAQETDPQLVSGVHELHINLLGIYYFFPSTFVKYFKTHTPNILFIIFHSSSALYHSYLLLKTSNSCYSILFEHNHMTKTSKISPMTDRKMLQVARYLLVFG